MVSEIKNRWRFFSGGISSRGKIAHPQIDRELLDDHLGSIRSALVEIHYFTKKKIATNPTHIYWKPINIELAWNDVMELFANAYAELCMVSRQLHIPPPAQNDFSLNFKGSLIIVIGLIDELVHHIDSSEETQQHTQAELVAIDEHILSIQQTTNRIKKHVMVDFEYPSRLARNRQSPVPRAG